MEGDYKRGNMGPCSFKSGVKESPLLLTIARGCIRLDANAGAAHRRNGALDYAVLIHAEWLSVDREAVWGVCEVSSLSMCSAASDNILPNL